MAPAQAASVPKSEQITSSKKVTMTSSSANGNSTNSNSNGSTTAASSSHINTTAMPVNIDIHSTVAKEGSIALQTHPIDAFTSHTLHHYNDNAFLPHQSSLTTTTHDQKTAYASTAAAAHLATREITSVDAYLDALAALRLQHLPQRGSHWDRTLQSAEAFGSLVHHVCAALSPSSPDAVHDAAKGIWTAAHQLLLLSAGVASPLLERAFSLFHRIGLGLAPFAAHRDVLTASVPVRAELEAAVAELLALVREVANGLAGGVDSAGLTALMERRVSGLRARREALSDALWAWRLQGSVNGARIAPAEVRGFLRPQDSVVEELVAEEHVGERAWWGEYSCEWFGAEVQSFLGSEDKVFLVTGKPGSGKSVLAGWVAERLRKAEGGKSFDVLSFAIEPDIQPETTTLSVVKNLLLQLFTRSVGDAELYEKICSAMEIPPAQVEKKEMALWEALRAGLEKRAHTVLVVDGLDQASGGHEASAKLLDQLHEVTRNSASTKTIVMSRPLSKSGSHHARKFSIEKKYIEGDLTRVTESLVASVPQLRRLSDKERITVVQNLVNSADGSFVWPSLAVEVLKPQKSFAEISSTLDKLPAATTELVQQLVSLLDFSQKDTRSILAWVLAAERPFKVTEIKELLSLDLANLTTTSRVSDTQQDVLRAVGPLVHVDGDIVRLRPLVRQPLLDLADSVKDFSNKDARFPFNVQEAHYDLVNKTLGYVNVSLHENLEPALDPLPRSKLVHLFNRHPLLEYAARYWGVHFLLSPMYESPGNFKLTGEFKKIFPDSAALAVLESTCWVSRRTPVESAPLFHLALHLRQTLIPENKEAIFQSLVTTGRVYSWLAKDNDASTYYFQAYKIGSTFLGPYSRVLAAAIAGYINTKPTVPGSTRTEEVTTREKMFQCLVDFYKYHSGASHTLTITYTKYLVDLYLQIGESSRAVDVQRELYHMCIEQYGNDHPETVSVYTTFVQLLKETKKIDELTTYEVQAYQMARNSLSLTDTALVKKALGIVKHYEEIKDISKAEQILVELWQAISREAQTQKTELYQERKFQVTWEYISFLEKYSRTQDVKNILLGVWSEYKEVLSTTTDTTLVNSTVAQNILMIGQKLQKLQQLEVSHNIYHALWSFAKRTNRQTAEWASESATLLTETTLQLVKRAPTANTDTSEEETLLLELFESSLSTILTNTTTSKTTSKIQSSFINTAQTLSTRYASEKKWTELIGISTKSLQLIWPEIFTREKAVLVQQNRPQALTVAKNLAVAYFNQRQIPKAEEIYSYIFQASKTLKPEDTVFTTAADDLITFYETTYQYDKVVSTLVEVYTVQKSGLKPDHPTTVKTAYRLAKFCLELGKVKEAEKYFYEIFLAFKPTADTVKPEAVEATLALAKLHQEQKHWEDARHFYDLLWKTFLRQDRGYTWTEELAASIFFGIYNVLEVHIKVDYNTLKKVSLDYKERCIKLFGVDSEVTIDAILHLASVYERSEDTRSEAISLYEQVFSSTTTAQTSMTTVRKITQARQRLGQLYASQTSTTTKAVTLYTEEYQKTVTARGYASREALQQLSKIVETTAKQQTKEAVTKTMQMLQTITKEIIHSETDSQKLYESATAIAKMYLLLNQKDTAVTMAKEMRHQAITQDFTNTKTISLDGVDRRSYVFIVAFEQTITGSENTNFSDLLADLMTESLLYQAYTQSITSNAKFEVTFSQGCRLALFYSQKKRMDEYERTTADLYKRFAGFLQTTESAALKELFDICLLEIGKAEGGVGVLEVSSATIFKYLETSKFTEAHDLASVLFKFVTLRGGFVDQLSLELGFKLAVALAGRGATKKVPSDEKQRQQLLNLSSSILQEVLATFSRLRIELTSLPITELNELAALLGEQGNYEPLEKLLTTLWSTRQHRPTWSPSMTLRLGHLLISVQELRGQHAAALHLAADLTYNLLRVWGPADPSTVSTVRLLASLHARGGDHSAAAAAHEDLLRHLLSAVGEGVVPVEQAAAIAAEEAELLRAAYVRNGGWKGLDDAAVHEALWAQLDTAFAGQRAWSEAAAVKAGGPSGWSVKDKVDDVVGIWQPPRSFAFLVEEEAVEGEKKHENHLRRTSGLLAGWTGGAVFDQPAATTLAWRTMEDGVGMQKRRQLKEQQKVYTEVRSDSIISLPEGVTTTSTTVERK